jgi:hypothetical protein
VKLDRMDAAAIRTATATLRQALDAMEGAVRDAHQWLTAFEATLAAAADPRPTLEDAADVLARITLHLRVHIGGAADGAERAVSGQDSLEHAMGFTPAPRRR